MAAAPGPAPADVAAVAPEPAGAGRAGPDPAAAEQDAALARALAALKREPHRFTLFAALRLLERAHAGRPLLGESRRVQDDAVRLQQPPHLTFAPSDVSSFTHAEGSVPVLEQFSVGLFGPNGALPVHLTEYAFERRYQYDDSTISDFVNLFMHRQVSLFHRAWADAEPAASFDRPASDRFQTYLGALIGLAPAAARGRDGVPDLAKLARVSHFGPRPRSAAGLEAALSGYFRVHAALRQFAGGWLTIPESDRCRLGVAHESAQLGVGAALGGATWQCQSRFEILLGPLNMQQFRDFLPGSGGFAELCDLVRLYTNDEWGWQLRLMLRLEQVPRACLDGTSRLGWTSWVGGRKATASDVVLHEPQGSAGQYQ